MKFKDLNRKKILKITGIAALIGVAGIGVWKGPRIIQNMIAYSHMVELTKEQKDELKEIPKIIKKYEKQDERERLLSESQVYIDIVNEVQKERNNENEDSLFSYYLQLAEDVKTKKDGALALKFQEMTDQVKGILKEETIGLKVNLQSMKKDYSSLRKKYEKTPEWERFEDAVQNAEMFIKSDSLDVIEKEKLEKELLESYTELYGGDLNENRKSKDTKEN